MVSVLRLVVMCKNLPPVLVYFPNNYVPVSVSQQQQKYLINQRSIKIVLSKFHFYSFILVNIENWLTSSSELCAIDRFLLVSVVMHDVVDDVADDDGDLNGSISSKFSDNSSTRLLIFGPLITSSSSSELCWSYIRQFDEVTTFKKECEPNEQSVYDGNGFLSNESTEWSVKNAHYPMCWSINIIYVNFGLNLN